MPERAAPGMEGPMSDGEIVRVFQGVILCIFPGSYVASIWFFFHARRRRGFEEAPSP